jgi:oxygen-dependent protoporphyrinogen oxidase
MAGGPPGASAPPRKVTVVGAGIAGLAAAHYLRRRHGWSAGPPIDVLVLEAGPRPGGKLQTLDLDGLRVEGGADSFVVRRPWAVDLCRELGLEDQVIIPGATGAFVWARGRLVPFPERSAFGVPASITELLRWPGLSAEGRFRALGDLLRPSRKDRGDESLASLSRRRLGVEAAQVLVEPLLAGLHAADSERLSLEATFPELANWERDHGSLIRGARAATRAARSEGTGRQPLFATLWGGLERMTQALLGRIGPDRVRLDSPVRAVSGEGGQYRVETAEQRFDSDALVLATPAFEASRLLRQVNAAAARELDEISYTSTAVVILIYPEGTAVRLPEEGTGLVVPSGEGTLTACTWYSRKWPDGAFGTRAILRCFVGRAGAEQVLEQADDELIDSVVAEVEAITPIGASPEVARVVRWTRSMPQYEVGHLDRVHRIESALAETPGVFLAGSAYRGIGIADCIRQGRQAADRAMAFLGGGERRPGDGTAPWEDDREAISWTS